MKIEEHYIRARHASSLKQGANTRMGAVDVLAAAGCAAQDNGTALLLWSVLFQGRAKSKHALVDALAHRLGFEMRAKRWRGDARLIAMECVAWHLHGVCQPCGGRGYERVSGSPALSGRVCRHCGGSGKVSLPRGDAHTWLVDYMAKLTHMAGGQVMRKLASDMDL